MAPKKVTDSAKGKAILEAEEPASFKASGGLKPALVGYRMGTAAQLEELRVVAASATNEHGATRMKPANIADLTPRNSYYPVFRHSLFAGLVPPFSAFFLKVLEFYQIQLLHLHPNSILILSIFAFLCEAYIGIRPSVALFRSFYALRNTAPTERTGCVSFRIADGMGGTYIPIAWEGEEAVTSVKKRVDEFRMRWFFVKTGQADHFFEIPDAPPQKRNCWSSRTFTGPGEEAVADRLEELRKAGLTGQMVALEFIRRRIAPLQAHSQPMWLYAGARDRMRLHEASITKDEARNIIHTLFTSPNIPKPASDSAEPLYFFEEGSVLQFVEGMPQFGPRGLLVDGQAGPREDSEAVEQVMPADGDEEASESGAADAGAEGGSGGHNPSGASSPSRDASPVVQEISSGSGDSFQVAPSRRIEENEEESDDEPLARRRDRRSKAIHDRPAGTPETAPREEGASVPSRGAKRYATKWVDVEE
jgi:hypothetical protein